MSMKCNKCSKMVPMATFQKHVSSCGTEAKKTVQEEKKYYELEILKKGPVGNKFFLLLTIFIIPK